MLRAMYVWDTDKQCINFETFYSQYTFKLGVGVHVVDEVGQLVWNFLSPHSLNDSSLEHV